MSKTLEKTSKEMINRLDGLTKTIQETKKNFIWTMENIELEPEDFELLEKAAKDLARLHLELFGVDIAITDIPCDQHERYMSTHPVSEAMAHYNFEKSKDIDEIFGPNAQLPF